MYSTYQIYQFVEGVALLSDMIITLYFTSLGYLSLMGTYRGPSQQICKLTHSSIFPTIHPSNHPFNKYGALKSTIGGRKMYSILFMSSRSLQASREDNMWTGTAGIQSDKFHEHG